MALNTIPEDLVLRPPGAGAGDYGALTACLKQVKKLKHELKVLKEKKYKKRGANLHLEQLYRGRKSAGQIVNNAIAESKKERKKKQAIHKYNKRRAAEEDAAYAAEEAAAAAEEAVSAAEEEARLATASAGLRDFIDRHRVDDAAVAAADTNYKKQDGEKEWQKAFTQITKTRHAKGGRRLTRRRRRRRKRRRSRRRRKRRTRR